ncbi:MAG: hypothetical protein ACRC8C_00010 [Mycoplasmoidaceae bacterium]
MTINIPTTIKIIKPIPPTIVSAIVGIRLSLIVTISKPSNLKVISTSLVSKMPS